MSGVGERQVTGGNGGDPSGKKAGYALVMEVFCYVISFGAGSNLLFYFTTPRPAGGRQQLRFSRSFPYMKIFSLARLSHSVIVVPLPDPVGPYEASLAEICPS